MGAPENASELNISDDGNGQYHVNQFRIHFRASSFDTGSDSASPTTKSMLRGLIDNDFREFRKVFNGVNDGLAKNNASVVLGDKHFIGRKTLLFRLSLLEFLDVMSISRASASSASIEDLRKLPAGIDVLLNRILSQPHEDWVCILPSFRRATGFCVQTLKRHSNKLDQGLDSSIRTMLYALASLPIPEPAKVSLRVFLEESLWLLDLNRMHFLAGRRSWRFGVVSDPPKGKSKPVGGDMKNKKDQKTKVVHDVSDVFYLETAAVERNSKFGQLAEKIPGLADKIRDEVPAFWSTMLSNYVKANGSLEKKLHSERRASDNGYDLWEYNQENGVWARSGVFSDSKALKREKWVNSILRLNSWLGSQID